MACAQTKLIGPTGPAQAVVGDPVDRVVDVVEASQDDDRRRVQRRQSGVVDEQGVEGRQARVARVEHDRLGRTVRAQALFQDGRNGLVVFGVPAVRGRAAEHGDGS